MKYLHEEGILHRDLKPQNILVDSNYYPRICDFGLSRCFNESLSRSMQISMTGKVGTPLYMAPELLEDEAHYGPGVDVYAFGMIAYEIVSGKEPFSEKGRHSSLKNILKNIMNGNLPDFDETIGDKMKELISRCLSKDPKDRPSFADIFEELSNDFSYSIEDVDEDEINEYLFNLEESNKEREKEDKKKKKNEDNKLKSEVEKYKNENKKLLDEINKLNSQLEDCKTQLSNLASSESDFILGLHSILGQSLLNKLGLNFSFDEWIKAHNSGSIEENSTEIASYGVDLSKCNALPTNLSKAVFICCNTYTRPDYSLGVGPMNDSITVASYMKSIGFSVYFAHNPSSTNFLMYLKHFIQNTQQYLVVYYTGHGGSMKDANSDDADGLDEVLVFDDAFILDDKLLEAIRNSGKPNNSTIMLLTDCCHSGSIYDLQSGSNLPPNIMSLSAARDSETAKQTSMEGKDQGIFTFYFFKLLQQTPTLTPAKMETEINKYISKYEQVFTKYSTTSELYDKVIFQ